MSQTNGNDNGRGELVVKLDGLTRSYGNLLAANDVSFEIYKGEIFGFVGPNGAGKTTTMRMLATLDVPDTGDATICGESVIYDCDKVRRVIGYMPDSFGVYSNLSVYEYLDFFARAFGLKGEKRTKTLDEIIEFVGVQYMRNRPSNGLSKGMRQRLSLARALLHDPPVLILDEPAEGLDPRARIEFRELLKVLASDGKAILISSHILTELGEICHSAAFIEKGEIVESGKLDDIKQRARERRENANLSHVLKIRVLPGHSESLHKTLLEQPDVLDVRLIDENALVEYQGDYQQQSDLVKALVLAGVSLLEVSREEENLEDLFMSLTKGDVQ